MNPLAWLAELAYPPACAHCRRPLLGHGNSFLCPDCDDQMPWLDGGVCRYCNAPPGRMEGAEDAGRPAAPGPDRCSDCRDRNWRFARALGVARYEGPARTLVLGLKFFRQRRHAAPMGRIMAARVRAAGAADFDLVVPVPLSRARRRERGYNQAELLARALAEESGRPLARGLLRRRRALPPQTGKTAAARREFPESAFAARGEVPAGARILLVDDVMTTGATASAAAGALRDAGAKSVTVAVFCR